MNEDKTETLSDMRTGPQSSGWKSVACWNIFDGANNIIPSHFEIIGMHSTQSLMSNY